MLQHGIFILAEWVGERTLETCLGLNRRTSHCMRIWMWSPCLSGSSALSRKYSNSFSSATQCCLVLCFLPGGPHTSWLESKMEWLKSEPAFWQESRDGAWQSEDTSSVWHGSNNRHNHCVLFVIWFALCTGPLSMCAFSFVANLCCYHNNLQMELCLFAKVNMCTRYCLTYPKP